MTNIPRYPVANTRLYRQAQNVQFQGNGSQSTPQNHRTPSARLTPTTRPIHNTRTSMAPPNHSAPLAPISGDQDPYAKGWNEYHTNSCKAEGKDWTTLKAKYRANIANITRH